MSNEIAFCRSLRNTGYWADRISREIEYADSLREIFPSLSAVVVESASHMIRSTYSTNGCIPKETALEAERLLAPYYDTAKAFEVDCVGHAHIDMNWMWGMHETVSIVLETFRTMLTLMEEYPEFTFAQSQAATYRIVEKYEPTLLQAIRRRVQEGRWEITATAWTEFDKNLSSGESHYRQYRNACRYMTQLFGCSKDMLKVGFEPDTFGHHAILPDILSSMGIRYYYHCRGEVAHSMYRWRGKQGGEVLVYREPSWYLGPTVSPLDDPSMGTLKALEMDMAAEVLKMYGQYGVHNVLQVYGVGDHGGGPTRMDIEGLIDMSNWPCYPKIKFSTYRKFFETIDSSGVQLPVVEGEVNRIFAGCYTSQSEIKRSNHKCELLLYESEVLSSVADLANMKRPTHDRTLLKESWEPLLFNQFHDILPGSCTNNSKSFAMGLYQSACSGANTVLAHALGSIAGKIDTSTLVPNTPSSGKRAFGAGVGYNAEHSGASPHGSMEGPHRVVTLFNSTSSIRDEVARIILWDWEAPSLGIRCRDHAGKILPVVVESDRIIYWQHSAVIVLVAVSVPAFGYSTLVFDSMKDVFLPSNDGTQDNPRMEDEHRYIVGNDHLRAVFACDTLEMISLYDLDSQEELLSGRSGFTFLMEDASIGMTSWKVGRESMPNDVRQEVRDVTVSKNSLSQSLVYTMVINDSRIKVNILLNGSEKRLKISSTVQWREIGSHHHTPQLSYTLQLRHTREPYVYAIPYGTIVRQPSTQHMPGQGWVARRCGTSIMQLSAKGKYGFQCDSGQARVILLRSSSDPDALPEIGDHEMEFAISLHDNADSVSRKRLLDEYRAFSIDLQQYIHGGHQGCLPLENSFLSVDGNFHVTAVEILEDSDEIEIRGHETEGEKSTVEIKIPDSFSFIGSGALASNDHSSDLKVDGNIARCIVQPHAIHSFRIKRMGGIVNE
jgi:alpha-mannosidase